MQPALRKGDEIADLFARASAFHRAGDLEKAQAGYKKILKKRPNHFGALYQLGLAEHQSSNSEAAERLLKRALLVDPQNVAARYARAVVLSALQRDGEALTCFDDLLALKPDFFDAHLERGKLLSRLQRFADAISSYDTALQLNRQRLDLLMNKGEALHYLGRFVDAIACYDQLLAAHPTHVAALINRGCAFKDLRRADEAIAEFNRALALAPDDTTALINRGETFLTLKRNDEALADFDRVIALDPRFTLGWLGRANVLMLNKQVSEALEACQRALAIEPNSAKALSQIGQCHALLGDAQAAVAFFDRVLAIDPSDEIALANRIFSLDFCEVGYAQHQAARSEWWRRIGSRIAEAHPPDHANVLDPHRRLVVGYVSGDFREHSAARTFRPVLQNHDKSQVEVICYSNSPVQDEITASLKQAADRWRDVMQWSDDQLTECIRADQVDILVDLSGHSRGNRLGTFARKPAPVQVTAWGHATGTGLTTMDYLFGDPVMAPPEVRHLFAEQVHDLPCMMIIEPPPEGLRSLEAPVISNGHVTYGAFTRANRLSSAVIDVWARILRADVTSRLLVKDYLLSDIAIQAKLLAEFAARGIAADRIDLIGPTSRDEHLAAHRLIDIWLDPFPNGGGVSAWEALHMGVPVISKLGSGMCSRAGAAILTAIGMADWVATTDDDYVDIALRSTADQLRTIRRQLPDLIAARCAPPIYTRAVEAAYRTMWQTYCRGRQS
ncbi:putative O-linked N-acetylglucosamine transferase, SPINDLY family; TPR domain protein [Bradyrhizobium sp. ORS 285]|uniref:tetratricopeptide repeat protein n=1 Tax=Bradyrhizobium sp. ORS 285 TaxID=115808 RepID=UPI000240AC0D|nr:tetratricopeptide repeat protein [Bradyrhizobium sp. ORS 285]CCD88262.1 putative O-linked N-acetylglucosamine transferase, SPINDLY family; TPR domain protein [Bradyrhizobium sp. ORS 285]SMX56088.1 putative O-linked N-acetylglucosamine transferase, SPINDLY family; TPR domain protein [Bradyrhizobium sp. ORS 285]